MNFKPVFESKHERPYIIAGPCSAETEEQVLETAQRLSKQKVHLLRAGIWKPRTRPNSFEGIGSPALKWLKKASKETGLPVHVADDPLSCVAVGTGKALDQEETFSTMLSEY